MNKLRFVKWLVSGLILICFVPMLFQAPVVEIEEPSPEMAIMVVVSPKPKPAQTSNPSPTPSPKPEQTPINTKYFEQLRREYDNDDIVGYLKIEGTSIDYPVVQSEDNFYYLDYNIYKEEDVAGWVFLDYENDTARDDPNTIIYAHNMRKDIMFHSIRHYTSKEYFENHRYITFNTEYADQTWEIFSFYSTLVDLNEFNYIQVFFESHDDFVNLLTEMKSKSMYDTGVEIYPDDRVLVLSTCVGGAATDERYVVNARLVDLPQGAQ